MRSRGPNSWLKFIFFQKITGQNHTGRGLERQLLIKSLCLMDPSYQQYTPSPALIWTLGGVLILVQLTFVDLKANQIIREEYGYHLLIQKWWVIMRKFCGFEIYSLLNYQPDKFAIPAREQPWWLLQQIPSTQAREIHWLLSNYARPPRSQSVLSPDTTEEHVHHISHEHQCGFQSECQKLAHISTCYIQVQ